MARDVQSAALNMREGPKKSAPKVIDHIRIHPRMKGGVSVAHHYTAMEHEPKTHNFGPEQAADFHEHIAKHTGMAVEAPMDAEGETNTEMPAGE